MLLTCATLMLCAAPPTPMDDPTTAPPELGVIHWERDFDAATTRARAANIPLLVLFQEVPGCATCRTYGSTVLSHPLIVEAAETLFVPAAVYNNIKGRDAAVLERFKEPAWNNPVVRIMRPDHTMLADRVAGDYTAVGLARAMVSALTALSRPAPRYLELLAAEPTGPLETATFAMHCFWEGEMRLGVIPGVATTRPGFLGALEVVEVQFDPATVDYATLLKAAKQAECASTVFARTAAQHAIAGQLAETDVVHTTEPIRLDEQPKYYLWNSRCRWLPMTEAQAIHVNIALFRKEDPRQFLSPRQIEILEVIERHPDAGWPSMVGGRYLHTNWMKVSARAKELAG